MHSIVLEIEHKRSTPEFEDSGQTLDLAAYSNRQKSVVGNRKEQQRDSSER